MSITPLNASALAESTLFTSLANANSASSTSSSSAPDLVSSFLSPSSSSSTSIFPDFPTEATLTATINASLGLTSTTADPTSATNSLSSLAQDFTSLLKELASGDVSASQSAVAKLQADLSAGNYTSTSGTSSASNPLQKLLTTISSSLSSNDTTAALKSLASFLVQGGSSTAGSLVDTFV